MKTICFLFLVCFAATALALTKEVYKKSSAATAKCIHLPGRIEDRKEDCLSACYMKEMGYMKNKQIDMKVMEETNQQKWDDPKLIEKGIQVDRMCAKEVAESKNENECSIGYIFATCRVRLTKETGLPPPSKVE